jgi:hypothetical protein
MPTVARIRHLRRALAQRLERLRETLEELLERVREAVAQAVSQAVSAAVREVIVAVLAAATDRPGLPPTSRWPPERYDASWHEHRAPSYRDSAYANSSTAWWTEDEPEDGAVDRPPPRGPAPSPSRWRCALSLGCQATAWLLRRWPGRRPLLAALAVGAACATGAYAVGAGLAHQTLRWLALLGALGSGIWTMSWVNNM